MSQKDEKRARANIAENQQRLQAGNTAFQTEKSGEYNAAQATNQAQRAGIYGGYQNFSDTGGIDDATAAQIRTRASLAPASYFGNLQDTLRRRSAAAGGNTTGLAAGLSRLGRQGAEAGAEGALNADIGIASERRLGKLAGLSGMLGVNTSVGGEPARLDASRLQAMGLDSATTEALLGLQNQLATRPGPFQNVMQGIQTIGGAAGGVLGGLGRIGVGGRPGGT